MPHANRYTWTAYTLKFIGGLAFIAMITAPYWSRS